MGQVLARAQMTRAQVSPFESRLVLALGYKHLELASHIKLETAPTRRPLVQEQIQFLPCNEIAE